MKAWLAIAIGVAALLALALSRRDPPEGDNEAALRAAQHTIDTMRARYAEREMQRQAENDSLKVLLRRPSPAPLTLRDTLTEYVFLRDTLKPRCEQCAANQDSAKDDIEAERRAAQHIENLMRLEIADLKRTRWYDRFSVGVGYGVTKVGPNIVAGPQVQFQLRVWP